MLILPHPVISGLRLNASEQKTSGTFTCRREFVGRRERNVPKARVKWHMFMSARVHAHAHTHTLLAPITVEDVGSV